MNLLRFGGLIRELIGEAKDVNDHSPVICSQYAFDAIDRGAGIKLLNVEPYKVAPGYLAWSPLLVRCEPLKPL